MVVAFILSSRSAPHVSAGNTAGSATTCCQKQDVYIFSLREIECRQQYQQDRVLFLPVAYFVAYDAVRGLSPSQHLSDNRFICFTGP